MADKIVFKVFSYIFLFLIISDESFSFAAAHKDEKCTCYNVCSQNFTTNSIQDVPRISACQRGCRFHTLVVHTFHDLTHNKGASNPKEGCLLSCSESYMNQLELSACKFGCSAFELSAVLCKGAEIQNPQISYSFLIEESDVLIHPGEPDPDDSLTDPGLRKQFQKTLVALLDATPKIPEIRFRNLPIRTEKVSEVTHASYKCPKFYGLDSKFEFRNGKIIIGDLYLFFAVFVFVVLCFLLGHHLESKSIKRQLLETRMQKKEDLADREPLLKVDVEESDSAADTPPEYYPRKPEVSDSSETVSQGTDEKFESITLVFQEDELSKDYQNVGNSLKI